MKSLKVTILTLLVLMQLSAPTLSFAKTDYEKGVGWVYLDGVLTITANGGMEDFFNNDPDQNGKRRYQHRGYEVKSVVIGKNVTQLHMFASGEDFYPTSMSVEAGNSIFAVIDGWLLNTQTKTLICATDLDRFTWIPVARKIPDSVEKIGIDAFYPYNHIIQIHLPDSVTEIGEFTFDACNNLESIQLPPNLKIISRGAFCGCESLRKVDMDMSIESIGEYAFEGCYNLERVNLENTRITVLSSDVFSYTRLKNLVLPDTLQRIEPEAFSNCSSLYSITVCSDDVVFQHNAFAECDKLRKIIFTKGVPKSMGKDLFSAMGETSDGKHFLSGYYESFKKEIPYPTLYYTAEYANQWAPNGETERNGYPIQQLTAKEERALAAKTERHEYTPASESVTDDYEAGDGWVFDSGKLLLTTNQGLVDFTANQMDDSFDYRYSHFPSEVDTIVIGKDVSYVSPVANYRFWYFSPTKIQIEPGNPYFVCDNGWIVQAKTKTLVCPENYPDFSKTTALNTLPDDTRIIGQSAFDQFYLPYWYDDEKRAKIEQVTFPRDLVVIRQNAFSNCEQITRLDLPPRLASIENYAFYECSGLQEVQFGPVRSLGMSAFYHCHALAAVNLEDTRITTLRGATFSECKALPVVILPETLQTVETEAFEACESLETAVFLSDHVAIQSKAFDNCIGLKYMIFAKGVPASFGESVLGETASTPDGRYYISGYRETLSRPIPYPTLLYTAAYASEWAPNGETEWNGYPIQQISQEELAALLAEARGKTAPAEVTPSPTPLPISTQKPSADTSADDGWVSKAFVLAIVMVGVAIAVLFVNPKRKRK